MPTPAPATIAVTFGGVKMTCAVDPEVWQAFLDYHVNPSFGYQAMIPKPGGAPGEMIDNPLQPGQLAMQAFLQGVVFQRAKEQTRVRLDAKIPQVDDFVYEQV